MLDGGLWNYAGYEGMYRGSEWGETKWETERVIKGAGCMAGLYSCLNEPVSHHHSQSYFLIKLFLNYFSA